MESFLDAIRDDQFGLAAHALNLNAIPVEEQAEKAPAVALRLAFVLRRYDLINWAEIPDQPDARVLPGVQQSTSPYSRRSVELGEVELDGRPVSISLQRFRAAEGEPVWLFSPLAVERAEEIFGDIRPGLIGAWVPPEQRLDSLGQNSVEEMLAAAILLLIAAIVGLAVYYGTRALTKLLPAISWYLHNEIREKLLSF